ncbi:MAG: hypothetical protein A2Y33_15895 [Spirochaetes bacterium GWF1_51_8]|nr:MAG: hypothetical protein A2Y33_15895 [Spirochaetes bacterium GWF1_51_8]
MRAFFFLVFTVFIMGCAPKAHLVILHTGDTLSQFFPSSKDSGDLGGAVRLKTYIEEIRGAYPEMLIFDSGGILPGSVYASVYKGLVNIEVMNAMGYSAINLGHHEFDYGMDNLYILDDIAKFPFLSLNLVDKGTTNSHFMPYFITNISGTKIVVIGIAIPDQGLYNREVAEQIDILPPELMLNHLIKNLKLAETNDILICLSYLGFDRNIALAEGFPELDIILSGYGDTKTIVPFIRNNTFIVQSGKNSSYVGKIDLELSQGKIESFKYELVPLDKSISDSKWVLTYLNDKMEYINQKMMEKVCDSMQTLDSSKVRSFPTPLGNMVADIMAAAAGADIALINAGAIRDSIPMGTVRLSDLFQMMPYENYLVKGKVSGSILKEIIKKGVDKRGSGGFLCISKGLTVTIETNKEVTVKFNNVPLDEDKNYLVASADFLWLGGDGYNEFKSTPEMINTGMLVRDALIAYLKGIGMIDSQVADPLDRIVFMNETIKKIEIK